MGYFGSDATAVTEAGRKEILALMKSRGYSQETRRYSAMYETYFTRADGRRFTVTGWHGTGSGSRGYGTGKTMFDLYDGAKGYKAVIGASDNTEDHTTWTKAQQEARNAEILAYLRANA